MKEYLFPLVTDELRIAFLQSTNSLCADVQRIIWEEVVHCTQPVETPPTPPKKCRISYTRLQHYLPRNLIESLNV